MSAWTQMCLGEVCAVVAGQSPEGTAYNDRGEGLPFYQGKKEFTDRYLAPPSTWTTSITKRAFQDDILMSVRAPVGPINFARQEICIGRGLAAIRASSKIDNGFLWYALLWLQPTIVGNAGAVFPSINKKQIEALPLPIPPLGEQKRIVAVLDQAFAALDRARALAEANLADAEVLFENSLDALFDAIRERSKLFRLEEICTIGDGNHSSKYPKRDEMVEQGVPFLRSSNIQEGKIVADDLLYISPKKHQELKKGHLQVGDILFTNRGEIGKVAILPKEFDGSNLNSQVAWLRSRNNLNAEFLFYYLQSGYMRRHYQNAQTGAALQQFPIKMVKAIEVPVPDLEDQHAIAEQLGGLRAKAADLANSYASKRDAIADLRQSLLQKAFAGELT